MNSSDLKFLGETIKAQREEMKFTLREFAKVTGVSFSQLSKIERGEHRPTRETLDKIAKYIHKPKVWLYLMAGYAETVTPVNNLIKKELDPNPVIHDLGKDQQMFNLYPNTSYVKEHSNYDSIDDEWNRLIDKMELVGLGPREVEEIVESYLKIKKIVLKK